MFSTTQIIIAGAIVVALSSSLYAGYVGIKKVGYEEANATCIARFEKYKDQIDTKLESVQTSLNNSTKTLLDSSTILKADISKISTKVSKIPTTIKMPDGTCTINPQLLESINEAVARVDKEIKAKK